MYNVYTLGRFIISKYYQIEALNRPGNTGSGHAQICSQILTGKNLLIIKACRSVFSSQKKCCCSI